LCVTGGELLGQRIVEGYGHLASAAAARSDAVEIVVVEAERTGHHEERAVCRTYRIERNPHGEGTSARDRIQRDAVEMRVGARRNEEEDRLVKRIAIAAVEPVQTVEDRVGGQEADRRFGERPQR